MTGTLRGSPLSARSWRIRGAFLFVASVVKAIWAVSAGVVAREELYRFRDDDSPFERWISPALFNESADLSSRTSSESVSTRTSAPSWGPHPTPYDIAVCFTGIPVSSKAGPSAKRFVFDVLQRRMGRANFGPSERTGARDINIDVFFVTEAGSHEELAKDFGFGAFYDVGMVRSAVFGLREKMFEFFDVYEPHWRFRLRMLENLPHSVTAWDGPKPFFVDKSKKHRWGEKGARTAEMGALHVYQDFMCHELMRVEEGRGRGGRPYHSVIVSRIDLLWLYELPVPPLWGPGPAYEQQDRQGAPVDARLAGRGKTKTPSMMTNDERTTGQLYFDSDFLEPYRRDSASRLPAVTQSREEFLGLRRLQVATSASLPEGEACWFPSVFQHERRGIQLFFWYCTRRAAEVASTILLKQNARSVWSGGTSREGGNK